MYFKRAHRVETQQNIERMTFALTWCANTFVGCSVTPTFFRQITSFSDSFRYTKKQKKICTWEVLIISHFTIHIRSNFFMNTGVRDLGSAFLWLILPDLMAYAARSIK